MTPAAAQVLIGAIVTILSIYALSNAAVRTTAMQTKLAASAATAGFALIASSAATQGFVGKAVGAKAAPYAVAGAVFFGAYLSMDIEKWSGAAAVV